MAVSSRTALTREKMKIDKSYHHGDLRNALILKGLEVLNEKGVSDLSLRGIARELGVGHNAPYRHFKNKTELLEAIASAGFRKLKAYNLRLELEYADDPETQLFESGMQLVTMAARQPHLFTLMFGGHLSLHTCGDELKEESQASMQSLTRILFNGQEKQVFSQDSLVRQTLSTMSIIYGFSMMATSGMLQDVPKDDNQLRAMAFNVFEVLLSGLRKR